MRNTRLQPVEEEAGDFQIAEPSAEPKRAISVPEKQIMELLLAGLGNRAMAILSTLFTLLLAGSAFWAWMTVLPSPTTQQLIGLGGYAVFILSLEFVRRR